jgi:hypothetical protein
MKSKKWFLIIGLVIIAGILVTSSTNFSFGKPPKAATTTFRTIQNNAFSFGERFDYEVVYGFVKAGTGYFQIMPVPAYRGNNRKCYDIRFQVSSLKSLEWIYKVKDAYNTILDVGGIFPWEFNQNIREGNYKKDYKATFDQVNHIAYADNKQWNVDPYINDIVSAFYYVRTMNLSSMKKGSTFQLKNFFDNKVNNLGVKIHGKETVEVKAGKFKCIKVEPLVVEGGLFKSEGNILIWLTDDEIKMPVKVSTKILIGYVSAELTKYSGLTGNLTSKVN